MISLVSWCQMIKWNLNSTFLYRSITNTNTNSHYTTLALTRTTAEKLVKSQIVLNFFLSGSLNKLLNYNLHHIQVLQSILQSSYKIRKKAFAMKWSSGISFSLCMQSYTQFLSDIQQLKDWHAQIVTHLEYSWKFRCQTIVHTAGAKYLPSISDCFTHQASAISERTHAAIWLITSLITLLIFLMNQQFLILVKFLCLFDTLLTLLVVPVEAP